MSPTGIGNPLSMNGARKSLVPQSVTVSETSRYVTRAFAPAGMTSLISRGMKRNAVHIALHSAFMGSPPKAHMYFLPSHCLSLCNWMCHWQDNSVLNQDPGAFYSQLCSPRFHTRPEIQKLIVYHRISITDTNLSRWKGFWSKYVGSLSEKLAWKFMLTSFW